jgi:hypothetical protein
VGTLNPDSFTPATWQNLTVALAQAQTVAANSDASTYQVDAAVSDLTSALDTLLLRAAKAGLLSAIAVAQTIESSSQLYVPSSLVGFAEALATAQAVYADQNASQSAVDAAKTALIARIAAVKLRSTGAPVSLLTVATASAFAPDQASAVAVAKAIGGKAFSKAPTPKLRGKAQTGAVLKVRTGRWTASPRLSYQWYRSGQAIKGATAKTYRLTQADQGKRITVKVSAKRAGYKPTTKTAKAVKVH